MVYAQPPLLDWTGEGPAPKDGLTSFWRLVVLGSLLWIDFSSPSFFSGSSLPISPPTSSRGCKEATGVRSANTLADKVQISQLWVVSTDSRADNYLQFYSWKEVQLSTP